MTARVCTAILLLLVPSLSNGWYVFYNETEAEQFLNLAAAAYPTPKNTTSRQQCIDRTYPDDEYQVLISLTAPCDKKQNECQAFAAVSTKAKKVILSFRGTEGFSQLWQEMRYSLIDYVVFNETDSSGNYVPAGRVNKYFYRAMDSLWKSMVKPIKDKYPGYRYLVTGHSLGGALAALTAFRLSYSGVVSDKFMVRLYTFGEPREGDYDYAQVFQQVVPFAFRLVHWTDPVPHLPPLRDDNETAPAYPFHHAREIWYDKKFQKYTQCNDTYGEDKSCSDDKRFWNYGSNAMDEHLIYFNHFISEYGWAGCQSTSMNSISLVFVILFLVATLHN